MSDTLRSLPASGRHEPADAVPRGLPLPTERRVLPVALLCVLIALLVVAAVFGWLVFGGDDNTQAMERVGVGALAPDFTLTDALTGQPVTLSALRGKPVWINFWASWCEACRDEMPLTQQAYDKHKADGLVVLGVNVQESPGAVRNFTSSKGYNWTFLLDSDGHITDRYYIGGIPTHVFISPDGVVRAIQVGGIRSGLDSLLAKILPGSR